jgi:hypothetical protein
MFGLLEITDEINTCIDSAELLLKSAGVAHTQLATYDVIPMDFDVKVISRFGRQYRELMEKADQLMPLLESLCIEDVITEREMDMRKAGVIRKMIKRVAWRTRTYANGLRRRMNGPPAEPDERAGAKEETDQHVGPPTKRPPIELHTSPPTDTVERTMN